MTEKIIKGVILYIQTKTGVKNGNEWKLYNVAIGDIQISTFNEIMIDGFKEGSEVVVTYTETTSGAYTNRTMISIKDLKAYNEASELFDKAKETVADFKLVDNDVFLIVSGKKYKLNCELVE